MDERSYVYLTMGNHIPTDLRQEIPQITWSKSTGLTGAADLLDYIVAAGRPVPTWELASALGISRTDRAAVARLASQLDWLTGRRAIRYVDSAMGWVVGGST